jgi:hypothetical protein
MNNKTLAGSVVPLLVAGGAFVFTPSCSSDKSSSSSGGTVAFGTLGVVQGAADSHCGAKLVTVAQSECNGTPKAPEGDAGAGGDDPYPPTMFGFEGDDDDCKYHVKWAVSSVTQKTNVTFTVVLTSKAGGAPVTGAPISAEVFLDDTHPAPNSGQKSAETSTPGTYTVGPIQFDAPGRWTARFHIHEECVDTEASPHGHAAFYVQIP